MVHFLKMLYRLVDQSANLNNDDHTEEGPSLLDQ